MRCRRNDAPLPGELEPYLAAKPEYDRKRAGLLKEYDVATFQAEWETGMRAAMDNPGKKFDSAGQAIFVAGVLNKPTKLSIDRLEIDNSR